MLILVNKMRDEIVDKTIRILEKNKVKGLTITELVKISKLSRHKVLTALAKLEGGNEVFIRKVGMAKIYILREKNEK
jgi:predicted transcriptional regulator